MKDFNVKAYMFKQRLISIAMYIALIICVMFVFYCLGTIVREIVKPLPDVMWSYTKDECVAVYYEDEKCDCSDLPDKYNRIWVQ